MVDESSRRRRRFRIPSVVVEARSFVHPIWMLRRHSYSPYYDLRFPHRDLKAEGHRSLRDSLQSPSGRGRGLACPSQAKSEPTA